MVEPQSLHVDGGFSIATFEYRWSKVICLQQPCLIESRIPMGMGEAQVAVIEWSNDEHELGECSKHVLPFPIWRCFVRHTSKIHVYLGECLPESVDRWNDLSGKNIGSIWVHYVSRYMIQLVSSNISLTSMGWLWQINGSWQVGHFWMAGVGKREAFTSGLFCRGMLHPL